MAANDVPCCEPMFWVYLIICVALVCFAGLMSGLTLGLMSLSLVDLEVLVKSGQPKDRKNAGKILPLVKNQHLLLCTLLIYNAMAMEALPIFVDALLPAWASILISVTLILAFGEIIPQAVCSQYGLSVGAKLSVLVRLLVILLLPISYPISKLLDWLLGKGHAVLLRRSELKTFVDLHANEAGKGGELTHDETTIIGGALDLTTKTAKDAMTPMSKVFSLDIDAKLDKDTMELIMRKGHSRVPVFSGSSTNIIGLILVKNLIICHPEDETVIRNLTIRKISRFYDHLPLYDVLNQFQKGHSHMGVVVRSKQGLKDMSDATFNSATSAVKASVIRIPEQSGKKGTNHQYHRKEQKETLRNTSAVHSTKTGPHNHPVIDALELGKSMILHHEDAAILQVPDLDSCADPSEEVIGIITMEDVMEELLQEEIYDETDDYVDVHNNIQINMLPVIRSRTPEGTPVSHRSWSSVASPRSSYHNTPILRSPTQAFVPSPLIRPSPLSPPIISRLASPSTYLGSPMRTSPAKQDKPSQYGKHTNILYGQALNTRGENMNTQFTSYHKPLFTQNLCSKDHRNQPFNPTPIKTHLLLSTTTSWKLHAQSKGFGDGSKTIQKKENAPKMSSSQEEDDDDKIPEIVFDRMIKRILASVGIPMAMGAVLLKTFDILKEKQMWDVPLWVTFITTFVFFGSSVLGVAYGSLSTSWNSENKGSLLGFEEAKENWVEMWKEEDGQKK